MLVQVFQEANSKTGLCVRNLLGKMLREISEDPEGKRAIESQFMSDPQ